MRSKYLIPTLAALSVLVCTEAFVLWYMWWWLWLPLLCLLLVVALWYSVVDRLFSRAFLQYAVTPLLFTLSIFAFTAYNESVPIRHVLIVCAAFLIWLYYEQTHKYNFDFEHYSTNAIENISGYINLLTFFMMTVGLYVAQTLVGVPLWSLLIIFVLVTVALLWQSLWVARISHPAAFMYFLVLTVILVESFWALAFLPTNFYAFGFFLTVMYYIGWGLSKSALLQILSKNLVLRYLVLGGVASLAVIITTAWI